MIKRLFVQLALDSLSLWYETSIYLHLMSLVLVSTLSKI
jgi:hypothetical protein